MTEKETIKDLERQANNTRHLMDRLNRAAYGMTFEEALKLGDQVSDSQWRTLMTEDDSLMAKERVARALAFLEGFGDAI